MIDLRKLDGCRETAFDAMHGLPSNDDSRQWAGAFRLRADSGNKLLLVIASSGAMPGGPPWDHVSVSLPHRCPTWDEMCRVRAVFFDPDATVMQLHPAQGQNISNHRFCLHLWRPCEQVIPLPPSILVGLASLGELYGGEPA